MFDFRFADIGEGIHEGTLLKWFFKEGDEVKEGDSLFLVETDKVNAEIPSPVSGKIAKLMAGIGDIIHVGDVIVKIDDGSQSDDKSQDNDESQVSEPLNEGEKGAGVVGEIEVSSEVIESSDEGRKDNEYNSKKILATPVARKLAKELGIDINTIQGTGPVGRVMKEDIYRAKESFDNKQNVSIQPIGNVFDKSKAVVPEIKVSGDVERIPILRLRKTIAENMVLSKSIIPHATTMDDFDVSDLVKLRKEQKEMAEEMDVNLTYMPFIIKAVTKTLKEFPIFNSSYDDNNEEILLKKYYNIGIATDTPEGLMVPVIKDADKKGILELASELENVATKARSKTISLNELNGGTFTITNYGSFGSSYGVPVIRYPESAILGVGRIAKKPVVINDEIVIRDMIPISLSIDHRIIDGADAGRFLTRLKEYLGNPMLLLLS